MINPVIVEHNLTIPVLKPSYAAAFIKNERLRIGLSLYNLRGSENFHNVTYGGP